MNARVLAYGLLFLTACRQAWGDGERPGALIEKGPTLTDFFGFQVIGLMVARFSKYGLLDHMVCVAVCGICLVLQVAWLGLPKDAQIPASCILFGIALAVHAANLSVIVRHGGTEKLQFDLPSLLFFMVALGAGGALLNAFGLQNEVIAYYAASFPVAVLLLMLTRRLK